MPDVLLSVVLQREHHEIDCGVAAFIEKLDGGCVDPEPLCAALEALRRHIYLEETFLFPPIREAGLIMPIAVMMREHGQLWHAMDALVGLLDDTADHEPLRESCHRLLGQLEQHNSKEEPIVYPHADSDLPSQVHAELIRFIEVGRVPHGWVCQQAAR
ncbi:hemerythrin domain-containing protein [Mycolicibacterium sp. P1-5]|uniref:hemerythrin domain-containing protein n=1 Tax=Mycolicibacterium sp. P1-5 TaxID=2024617 RepID=UPI0011F04AA9|nr:hemerythrin domain-containing protein [Mycolicibacterium sp. P1-5]KAA0107575.1 hemerythrin domain-containing protein [Mycolicibacterium sp. P1-5]